MEWLTNALRQNPELALFLSLAIGFAIGRLRLGSFQLGSVLGTLIAGLVVGQFIVDIPNALKSVFFLMFMFAIGFRTGPEFFRSLRSGALIQIALILLFCVTALVATWSAARVLGLGGGTAAGLLAGAQTNSTVLGSATNAAAGLNLEASVRTQVARDVANAYALTYVLGVLLAVWFIPNIGPRLMGVNLRDACREYEQRSDSGVKAESVNSAFREVTVRAYRLPHVMAGQTVREVERRWPVNQRVIIPRIRRADSVVEASATMKLRDGDVLVAAGRPAAFVADTSPLQDEVHDPSLLSLPTVGADLVLTNKSLAGKSLRNVAQEIGARGIFLAGLRRGGRDMPFAPSTIIERGDVLNVAGTKAEVDRVADEIGFGVYPTSSTNLMLVAATIFVGGLIGLPALVVGGITLSLSVSVGVLLAGLTLGYLRSINPRFAGIPDASVNLLESMGLAAFVGCVGIQAGPGVVTALNRSSISLLISAVIVVLLPPTVTILIGYYVARFPPGILLGLCAGAGTSAPTLAALEKAADSKVPTLGYGMACAAGNVLMAVWGTLLVVMGT
jgi:putative transport protein